VEFKYRSGFGLANALLLLLSNHLVHSLLALESELIASDFLPEGLVIVEVGLVDL